MLEVFELKLLWVNPELHHSWQDIFICPDSCRYAQIYISVFYLFHWIKAELFSS